MNSLWIHVTHVTICLRLHHRQHWRQRTKTSKHFSDVIMGAMASQITSLTIVYSTVYSEAEQRKHQSSASLAFLRGIHRWPVNSPHKWPVTRKMFPFDDVIMRHGLMWSSFNRVKPQRSVVHPHVHISGDIPYYGLSPFIRTLLISIK